MPYVLFWTTKPDDPLPETYYDHYEIFRDTDPIMLAADRLAKRKDVTSWGVAKIEAASEPQWTNNKLL
jgi:hypothetical protein